MQCSPSSVPTSAKLSRKFHFFNGTINFNIIRRTRYQFVSTGYGSISHPLSHFFDTRFSIILQSIRRYSQLSLPFSGFYSKTVRSMLRPACHSVSRCSECMLTCAAWVPDINFVRVYCVMFLLTDLVQSARLDCSISVVRLLPSPRNVAGICITVTRRALMTFKCQQCR